MFFFFHNESLHKILNCSSYNGNHDIKVPGISQIKKKSLFKDKSRYKNESILFLLWVWHHLNSTLVDQRNILLQGEAKYKLTDKSLFCPVFGDFNHYPPLFFYFNIGLRNLYFHFNFQSKAFFFQSKFLFLK